MNELEILKEQNKALLNAIEKIRFYAGEGQWLPCGRCTPAAELIVEMCEEARKSVAQIKANA